MDRPPVALWRHFPEDDQTAEGLARAVVTWQREHDWDLVKVTPTSGYPYEDWGARFLYRGNEEGTREVVERPVRRIDDWAHIRPLDVRRGVLGREVEATRLVAKELNGEAPIFQTVFSPSYVASGLSGRERFLADLREHADRVQPAIDAATETTVNLAQAFLQAGADGLFFATQLAAAAFLSEEEYRATAMPGDLAVLRAARERGAPVILHAHGRDVYFDLLATYPVNAMNWHDRATPPSLAQGKERFSGCVVGGIGEAAFLGPAEALEREAREAVATTGGRGMLLATGCVVPITAPAASLRAARRSVEPE